MPRNSAFRSGPQPTLASVANAAGVALVTASYALRDNPKISLSTRRRVQGIAKKLGYVPNPEIARLMHLLRSGKAGTIKSTIAVLSFDNDPRAPRNHYFITLMRGVQERAAQLGYLTDPMTIDSAAVGRARLTKILQSRGIQGIIVPPMRYITNCATLVDWSQFSVVAASYTAQNLPVHRVVPHHLQIGFLALNTLRTQGYTRIGLVTEPGDHERVSYSFLAALAMHQQEKRFAKIPPFQFTTDRNLTRWYIQHQPDLILATEERQIPTLAAELGARRLARSPVYLLNRPANSMHGGVYQHPEIVGRMSVDLVAGQIQRSERGQVAHPTVMMVEGSWNDPAGRAAAGTK